MGFQTSKIPAIVRTRQNRFQNDLDNLGYFSILKTSQSMLLTNKKAMKQHLKSGK